MVYFTGYGNLYQESCTQGITLADESVLCTALKGNHYKDPFFWVHCGSHEFVIIPPGNKSTEFWPSDLTVIPYIMFLDQYRQGETSLMIHNNITHCEKYTICIKIIDNKYVDWLDGFVVFMWFNLWRVRQYSTIHPNVFRLRDQCRS